MKYRIYVIEDDENIRNLICVALETSVTAPADLRRQRKRLTALGSAPERQGGAAGVSGDVCIRLDAAGDGRLCADGTVSGENTFR